MKKKDISIVIVVMCGMLCGTARSQMLARPKRSKPITSISKPTKASRYQRLLIKYLANIERIDRKRSAERSKEYQKSLASEKSKAEELVKNKASELAKLQTERNKRPSKKLDFRQDRYENRNSFIFGVSPESASIVETLHKDNAFANIRDVIWILQVAKSQSLCKEWVTFLEGVITESKKKSDTWRACVVLLYSKGNLRKKYHSIIRRFATEQQDVGSLFLMFSRMDVDTGKWVPHVTTENLALVKEMAKKKYKPGIRITCAHYALKIRDYNLSQAICKDLMTQKYKGMQNVDAKPPEEDHYLSYARDAAMILMFYGIKNERMFRLLYDRATIIDREWRVSLSAMMKKQKADPEHAQAYEPKWVSFGAYILGRLEVEAAKTLIEQVDKWNP